MGKREVWNGRVVLSLIVWNFRPLFKIDQHMLDHLYGLQQAGMERAEYDFTEFTEFRKYESTVVDTTVLAVSCAVQF